MGEKVILQVLAKQKEELHKDVVTCSKLLIVCMDESKDVEIDGTVIQIRSAIDWLTHPE